MRDAIAGLELGPLVESIKKSTGADTWKRGNHIARNPKVAIESIDEDEIELRVPRDKGILTWSVSLYPNDDEWCCDCPNPRDTCEHVCAAAIVAEASSKGTLSAPAEGDSIGRIHYAFSRDGATLLLRRCIDRDGKREELQAPLGRMAKDPDFVASVLVHERDLDIETILNKGRGARLGRERLPALFKVLQSVTELSLDGQNIQVIAQKTQPSIWVERSEGGVIVRLQTDNTIDEVFENGIARVGDTLRPIGDGGLSASETRLYARGRHYPDSELTRLMTKDLPDLESRVSVEWSDAGPPELETHLPQLNIIATQQGNELRVRAELIYGDIDNPIARVVDNQLEVLGDSVPLRDVDEEERLIDQLRTGLGLRPGVEASLRDEHALSFSNRLRSFPADVDEKLFEQFRPTDALLPELDTSSNQFHLMFRSGSKRVNPEQVLDAWSHGDKFVPLVDGGFAPIPHAWLTKCGHIVADLLEAKSLTGALPRASLPDLGRLCDSLDLDPPESVKDLQELVKDFSHIERATLPEDLRAELRVYQRDAVDWLSFLRSQGFGALLADDMGLGKTLQALTVVQGRTLVVAPTSVMQNWEKEARRFRPSLSISLFHGPNRQLDSEADITVTTYAVLRIDQSLLQSVHWDMVVLDEAQTIKNSSSKVAQAAFELEASFRLALTGTPVENRLEELWSQFHFLNPGLLGTKLGFQTRYAKPIERGDEKISASLRKRLKPFVLRRMKREVASELPPRTDIVLNVELSEDERGIYDALRLSARREVRQLLSKGGTTIQVLELLLRLRQAACHAGLLPGQHLETSSKVTLLNDTLEKIIAEGHKALVFSQWTSFLDRIQKDLNAREINHLRLDGSTRNRGDVVDSFQRDDGPPVLLLSLKAGGTGLNLTAADHVFIVDPWWNPAVEEQAADRAHRIGQERPVMVHRLIASDTVEEKIMALQERKRHLADQALSGANHGGKLTQTDLMALLDA